MEMNDKDCAELARKEYGDLELNSLTVGKIPLEECHKLMIKLADAKYIYDNPDTSQLDVENVVAELQ